MLGSAAINTDGVGLGVCVFDVHACTFVCVSMHVCACVYLKRVVG